MASEDKREWVLSYLYGELAAGQREAFETALEQDGELRLLLAEEQRFDQLYPPRQETPVGAEQLQESRLLLRAALRQESQRGSSFVVGLWRGLRPFWTPAATGLVALAIGVFAGRSALVPVAASNTALAIVDLQVRSFDMVSERIELVYTAVERGQIQGHLGDEQVRQVLAGALRVGTQAGDRLQAAELLGNQAEQTEIRQVLIYALTSDDNAGVRLKAIEALADMATRVEVRQALRQALLQDENPGVRVAAIEALRAFGDDATLAVMERKQLVDDNQYIRAEAERLSRAWKIRNEQQL